LSYLVSPLFAKARILVIESDPAMRAHIESIILPHVGEVFLAKNGEEGLRQWCLREPDVTLTEISVPSIDGLAMSEQIKDQDPDAAIVVISSSAETEHLRRAIDIGVDACFQTGRSQRCGPLLADQAGHGAQAAHGL
jgi:CheY-like chemotaxis protein